MVESSAYPCGGISSYDAMVCEIQPSPVPDNYSRFVLDNISGQAFCVIHGLNHQYSDKFDMVEELKGELGCTLDEALKRMLRRAMMNMNIDLNVALPLGDMAFEILACMRMTHLLANKRCQQEQDSAANCGQRPDTHTCSDSDSDSDTKGVLASIGDAAAAKAKAAGAAISKVGALIKKKKGPKKANDTNTSDVGKGKD